MSDPSSKARPRSRGAAGGQRPGNDRGPATSMTRTAVGALVALLGLVWLGVYLAVAQDGEQLTWMGDLGRWNFLIGFGLFFLGLSILAHPSTPLGRGRGVVVGMLGCFLTGLIWIIVYYMAGQPTDLPVFRELEAYNLVVGIGFMAVGFVFATRWE